MCTTETYLIFVQWVVKINVFTSRPPCAAASTEAASRSLRSTVLLCLQRGRDTTRTCERHNIKTTWWQHRAMKTPLTYNVPFTPAGSLICLVLLSPLFKQSFLYAVSFISFLQLGLRSIASFEEKTPVQHRALKTSYVSLHTHIQ